MSTPNPDPPKRVWPWRQWFEVVVELLGFVLIVAFFWLWWWPLSLLIAGILCVLWANRPVWGARRIQE